jgi:hypothetical protein
MGEAVWPGLWQGEGLAWASAEQSAGGLYKSGLASYPAIIRTADKTGSGQESKLRDASSGTREITGISS